MSETEDEEFEVIRDGDERVGISPQAGEVREEHKQEEQAENVETEPAEAKASIEPPVQHEEPAVSSDTGLTEAADHSGAGSGAENNENEQTEAVKADPVHQEKNPEPVVPSDPTKIKIRKRERPVQAIGGLGRKRRTEDSGIVPARATANSTVPSWMVKKPKPSETEPDHEPEPIPIPANVASSRVPLASWLRKEDLEKVHSKEDHGSYKKPSRRGNVQEQSHAAQLAREKEDLYRRNMQAQKQNIDLVVKDHYNKRTNIARAEQRHLSPIIKLKNFNNAVKYMLINNYTRPGDRVLELGCGKGGDMIKWNVADISNYVGIDISNASITEAISRYHRIRPNYRATFITGDCFGKTLPEVIASQPYPIDFPMDVVSMQFCLHYAYENEFKARTMLQNVSKSLKTGGFFIGTIPNSDFIKFKIKHLKPDSKTFGNSLYSVTFESKPDPEGSFRPPYGHIYNYYLKDAIDNVPEYVVPFESFRALALEYDLELRYKESLPDVFRNNMPKYFNKFSEKMKEGLKRSDVDEKNRPKYGVEGDEKEAVQFYLAFCFVKK